MANASEWAERVEAWRASGKTANEFASGRGFEGSTLRWWSSRLAQDVGRGKRQRSAEVRLARVVRRPVPPVPAEIVIELHGARVRVPTGADAATLATVLSVLGGES